MSVGYRPIRHFALRQARKTPDAVEWWVVRALIPESWFTKKGPGVLHEARRAWGKFTAEQKALAVERGWFLEGGPR